MHPGIKTQQITSGKATVLQLHNGNAVQRYKNPMFSKRVTQTAANITDPPTRHPHTRHFKSLSNISSTNGSNNSTTKDNMPLRINKNINNMQDQGNMSLAR